MPSSRVISTPCLRCRESGETFDIREPIWRSPTTGGLLDLEWPCSFPIDQIRARPATMWRYREALPIPDEHSIVTLGEGMTPLVEATLNGSRVLLKLDNRFPSGSYKDRGAAVLISHAKSIGIRRAVQDSSGNAGAAMAMYGARARIEFEIYVPESASSGKLIQVESSGARLVRVPGDRQATSDAVWHAAQSAYYASHSWNPFFFHGTKTLAYEVAEQLGWQAPAAVVIPTGNGTLLLGAWIGFEDLRRAGVIDRVPRLIGVQSQACAPLARASDASSTKPLAVTASETIAEGIAIAKPVRGVQCLEAVKSTRGCWITVDEASIVRSLREAVRLGYFIEPTCGSAIAALPALRERLGQELERDGGPVVVAITGHGLKATEKIRHLLMD
jgi:threonine synthase